MADLVYQFGRTILEGMFKENLVGLPHGDTATRVSGPWLVAGIEWFRPLLGGYVDSTDSPAQTDGRTLPPERPRWESNPRPPTCKSRRALPTELVGQG